MIINSKSQTSLSHFFWCGAAAHRLLFFGVRYQPLITASLNFRVSHFGTSKMICMIHRPKKGNSSGREQVY